MVDTETASPEALAVTRHEMEAAHDTYTDAFEYREKCERELRTAAERRAALVRALKQALRSLQAATADAIQSTIEDPESADASAVIAGRARVEVLKKALHKYSAFEYADIERALLAAKVEEVSSQKVFEERRRDHQSQSVLLSLASTMDIAGDLEVNSLGSVTEAMEKIVHEIGERLARARGELREHDRVTTEARSTYERENAWTN